MKRILVFILFLSILVGCESSPYNSRMIRLFLKGNEQLKFQQYEKAIHYYTEGIRLDSSLADIYNNRGIAYFLNWEYSNALQDYNKALQIKPDYTDARYNRSNVYFQTGNFEACLADLNEVVKVYPDSIKVLVSRAKVQLQLGKFSDAIQDLDKTIQLNPSFAPAYDSRGYLKILLKDWENAEKDLRKAIELDSRADLAWANLGALFTKQKKHIEAFLCFDKAFAITDNEIYLYNQRALTFLAQNELEKAKADIDKSLSINSEKNPYALWNMGIYFFKKEKYSEASQYFTKAEKAHLNKKLLDESTLSFQTLLKDEWESFSK